MVPYIAINPNNDVKWKSPWYVNPLRLRPPVSPSCPNCKDLLSVILLQLISETSTLGFTWNLWAASLQKNNMDILLGFMFKDPNHLKMNFGISFISYNTNPSMSLMGGSEYSQLVHSGLEIATKSWGASIADARAVTLVPLVPLGNCAGLWERITCLIVSLAVSKGVWPFIYCWKQTDNDLRWCWLFPWISLSKQLCHWTRCHTTLWTVHGMHNYD